MTHGLGLIPGGDSNIVKQVFCFLFTVHLAMSVKVDLFPSMRSFCDLAWGLLAMRIRAFLVVIDIYWVCCQS